MSFTFLAVHLPASAADSQAALSRPPTQQHLLPRWQPPLHSKGIAPSKSAGLAVCRVQLSGHAAGHVLRDKVVRDKGLGRILIQLHVHLPYDILLCGLALTLLL